ncbi:MAG: 2-hydroxymuconate tautomerase family protein [Candidatus Aminicenantes bacterium]|nr:2-hydroxymuconate tautomerase family protein [Candidatus Aminicenantes bacterium]
MPLVEVHLLEGRTDEQKEALLKAITTAVHESIDAPLPTIRVWINEFSPKHYMIAGELKSRMTEP